MKLAFLSLTLLSLLTSCAIERDARAIKDLDYQYQMGAISPEAWYYQRKALTDARNARLENFRRGMDEYYAEKREMNAQWRNSQPRTVTIKPTYGDNWPGYYTGTIY